MLKSNQSTKFRFKALIKLISWILIFHCQVKKVVGRGGAIARGSSGYNLCLLINLKGKI
jgi:hypothetical protein